MKPTNSKSMSDFRILKKIGEGSFGTVFKAIEIESGAHVAIKRAKASKFEDGVPKDSFWEIHIHKCLKESPSVVSMRTFFFEQDTVFIVFDCMAIDLHHVIKARTTPFSLLELKTIMRQILEALTDVHSIGLMHWDVKPSNFLFSKQNELKVCDFGLARISHNEYDN